MTYTDEELVRELEWRYPDCEFIMQARKRLLELSEEVTKAKKELESAREYEEELCGRIDGLEEDIRRISDEC